MLGSVFTNICLQNHINLKEEKKNIEATLGDFCLDKYYVLQTNKNPTRS